MIRMSAIRELGNMRQLFTAMGGRSVKMPIEPFPLTSVYEHRTIHILDAASLFYAPYCTPRTGRTIDTGYAYLVWGGYPWRDALPVPRDANGQETPRNWIHDVIVSWGDTASRTEEDAFTLWVKLDAVHYKNPGEITIDTKRVSWVDIKHSASSTIRQQALDILIHLTMEEEYRPSIYAPRGIITMPWLHATSSEFRDLYKTPEEVVALRRQIMSASWEYYEREDTTTYPDLSDITARELLEVCPARTLTFYVAGKQKLGAPKKPLP